MKRARRQDEEDAYVPTPEEEAEIEARLDELDRGEFVPLEDVMREVRAVLEKERERR